MTWWEHDWWDQPYADTVRDIHKILWREPYAMPNPTSLVIAVYSQTSPWKTLRTFAGLMYGLGVTPDNELLAIDGIGPAGLRRIRAAIRVARNDPWLAHAEMVAGVR